MKNLTDPVRRTRRAIDRGLIGRKDRSVAGRKSSSMSLTEAVQAVRVFATPYARVLGAAMVLAAVGSGMAAAAPLVVARLFDEVSGPRRIGVVIGCLAAWLVLVLLNAGAVRRRDRLVADTAAQTSRDLRVTLADVELRALGECESLEVTAISGVEDVTMTIARVFPAIAGNLAAVLVGVAAASVLDWRVGLVVLAAAAPVMWLTARLAKHAQDAQAAYTTAIKALAAEARRFFHPAGHELAAAMRARPQVMARITDIAGGELCDAERGRWRVNYAPVTQILGTLLGIALVMVAYLLKGVSLGAEVAFITLARQQVTVMLEVVLWVQQLADQAPHIQMVQEALEVPTERQGGGRLQAPDGRLEISDAGADYGDGRKGLDGLTLSVEGGEAVALAGHSGAGKTTITRLATGAENPRLRAGQILLDGVPIGELELDQVRQLVLAVPQSSWIFDGTVLENLLAPAGATAADIEWACRLAGLHDEITAWPGGYQTRIGTATLRVSGGQAQRLGLARALLRARLAGARVMLLDEATAALDPAASDGLLAQILAYLRGERIGTVVITHKLPVHPALERMVVIDQGRTIENGDPQQLAADPRSAYAQLLSTRTNPRTDGMPHTPRPDPNLTTHSTTPATRAARASPRLGVMLARCDRNTEGRPLFLLSG